MATTVKKAFSEWFEQKYLDWQAERGTRSSLKEFADHIGYSRPLISFWLGGQRLPAEDGVKRLAELFGPEIYDVLELPRPNPLLSSINRNWERVPEDVQNRISELIEPYITDKHEQKTPKSRSAENSA